MPIFTIATITRNNAHGLEKTWNSINRQSFKDFEWLVQDGASEDSTLQYLKMTPAITQSATDNGIYDAMNILIERSKGEYIIFLNAGDALATPETLELIAENIKESPDFVYGDSFEQSHDETLHRKKARNHKHIALGMFTHHQAMLYKTSIIKKTRYNETYKIAADYDFTLRILKIAETVKYLPTPICIFEPGGISQIQTKKGRDEQFQIRRNLKICNPVKNYTIRLLQLLNISFRKIAPNLYWTLRNR